MDLKCCFLYTFWSVEGLGWDGRGGEGRVGEGSRMEGRGWVGLLNFHSIFQKTWAGPVNPS